MSKVFAFTGAKRVQEPPTFQLFGRYLLAGDRVAAASVLEKLFGLKEDRAEAVTRHLLAKMAEDSEVLDLLRGKLRESVQCKNYNEVIFLLSHHFGLNGIEALQALGNLTLTFSHLSQSP